MKRFLFGLCSAIFALLIFNSASGQTYQTGWTFVLEDEPVICLGENLSGVMTYHAVAKVDRKTGYLKSIHWNIVDAFFIGSTTGNRYRCVDVGMDNLGWYFEYFNDVQQIVPEGTLPPVMPSEGMLVTSSFLWITQGGIVYKGRINANIKLNANGDLTVNKVYYDFCM